MGSYQGCLVSHYWCIKLGFCCVCLCVWVLFWCFLGWVVLDSDEVYSLLSPLPDSRNILLHFPGDNRKYIWTLLSVPVDMVRFVYKRLSIIVFCDSRYANLWEFLVFPLWNAMTTAHSRWPEIPLRAPETPVVGWETSELWNLPTQELGTCSRSVL